MVGADAATGAAAAPDDGGDADDYASRVVLEFLQKKGYRKAGEALVQEAMGGNTDARQMIDKVDDELREVVLLVGGGSSTSSKSDATRFEDSFCELRDWVDGSLDLYKRELHAVLYPILVHCFLELVRRGASEEARLLLTRRGTEFQHDVGNAPARREELIALAGVSAKEHLAQNQTAQMFLRNRYVIVLTSFAYELLIAFLTGDSSRIPLLRVLNQRCRIKVDAIGGTSTSNDQAGFDNGDVSAARPVLWGQLKREFFIAKDDPPAAASGLGDGLDDNAGPEPEVALDGTLTAAPLPLPTFHEGSSVLEALDEDDSEDTLCGRTGLSGTAPPSSLFYTVTNTHGSELHGVAMTKDCSMVAGGFSDSKVRGWDCTDGGKSLFTLTGHSGPVFSCDISFCGQFLLSGSEDGTARLWSIRQELRGADLVAYRGHNYPVWSVEFGSLGHYFATGGHDRTARVWSTDRVYPLRILAGHLADVDVVKWHENCAYLATGSSDRTARLWDIRSGDCVRVFSGMEGSVHSLAFSPSGRLLAMGDDAGNVQVVDVGSGKTAWRVAGGHVGGVWSVGFARGQEGIVASGGADCTVQVWEESTRVLRLRTKRTPVQHVQFSRKNLLVACGAILLPAAEDASRSR